MVLVQKISAIFLILAGILECELAEAMTLKKCGQMVSEFYSRETDVTYKILDSHIKPRVPYATFFKAEMVKFEGVATPVRLWIPHQIRYASRKNPQPMVERLMGTKFSDTRLIALHAGGRDRHLLYFQDHDSKFVSPGPITMLRVFDYKSGDELWSIDVTSRFLNEKFKLLRIEIVTNEDDEPSFRLHWTKDSHERRLPVTDFVETYPAVPRPLK